MRAIRLASSLGLAVVLAACSETIEQPSAVEVALQFSQHGSHNFGSALSGGEENPPVATQARGNAIFQLSDDGSTLHYKLIVANIDNVTQAHIHCGPAGVNGPIVLWLYPSAPPLQLIPGTSNGILNEDDATSADVIARPNSTACPGGVATLADVVAKLANGGAYANVHTSAFPPGEIRGQVEERGPSR
ncbi:MAG TPA: CHRD domain-containing protein [Longimicrobiales bacterium]